jgi:hypothetical protein
MQPTENIINSKYLTIRGQKLRNLTGYKQINIYLFAILEYWIIILDAKIDLYFNSTLLNCILSHTNICWYVFVLQLITYHNISSASKIGKTYIQLLKIVDTIN